MAQRGDVREIPLAAAKKPTDLLSAKEVAELCGMSHSRVCQLLNAGEMKGQKWLGIHWQVTRREAMKFAERPKSVGRPRLSEAG